jgi:hypothetical protein
LERGYVQRGYYRIDKHGGRERLEPGKEIHARSALNLTLEGCRVTSIAFRYDSANAMTWDGAAFLREHHPEYRGTVAWPSEGG